MEARPRCTLLISSATRAGGCVSDIAWTAPVIIVTIMPSKGSVCVVLYETFYPLFLTRPSAASQRPEQVDAVGLPLGDCGWQVIRNTTEAVQVALLWSPLFLGPKV